MRCRLRWRPEARAVFGSSMVSIPRKRLAQKRDAGSRQKAGDTCNRVNAHSKRGAGGIRSVGASEPAVRDTHCV